MPQSIINKTLLIALCAITLTARRSAAFTFPDDLDGVLKVWHAEEYLSDGATQTDSGYLYRANNSDLQLGNYDHTIAGWFSMPNQSFYASLYSKWKTGAGNQGGILYYNVDNQRFSYRLRDAGDNIVGHVNADALGIPVVNQLYFIRAWFDTGAGKIKIQVNNGATNDAALTGTPATKNTEARFGKDGGSGGIAGTRFDSIGKWNRMLTDAETGWLYNSGNGRVYAEVGQPGNAGSNLLTNLKAWWNMDEVSGARRDSHSTNHMSAAGGTVAPASGVPFGTPDQNGAAVKRWVDKSGNTAHLEQATASKKPEVHFNEVNSKPIARFDGTNDYLQSVLAASSFKFLHDGTDYLIYVVFATDNLPASQAQLLITAFAVSERGMRLQLQSDSNLSHVVVNGSTNVIINSSSSSPVTTGAWHIIEVYYDNGAAGDDSELLVENVKVGSGDELAAPSSSNPTATLNIGRRTNDTLFVNGDYAEVIIIQSPTKADRNDVIRHLANKYDITVSLPPAGTVFTIK